MYRRGPTPTDAAPSTELLACMEANFSRAFPVPETGCFNDQLKAIDKANEGAGQGRLRRTPTPEAST